MSKKKLTPALVKRATDFANKYVRFRDEIFPYTTLEWTPEFESRSMDFSSDSFPLKMQAHTVTMLWLFELARLLPSPPPSSSKEIKELFLTVTEHILKMMCKR